MFVRRGRRSSRVKSINMIVLPDNKQGAGEQQTRACDGSLKHGSLLKVGVCRQSDIGNRSDMGIKTIRSFIH